MTNKQKAQEFAEDRGHDTQSITEAFVAALDMAEWKEQQMIAFIDDEVNLIDTLLKKEETKEMLYRYEGIIDGLLRVKNKIINK